MTSLNGKSGVFGCNIHILAHMQPISNVLSSSWVLWMTLLMRNWPESCLMNLKLQVCKTGYGFWIKNVFTVANLIFPFYWSVEMVPRSGNDSSSSVIKLDTVRRIAEQVIESKPKPKPPQLVFRQLSDLFLLSGQASLTGHYTHCHRKIELYPVSSHGALLGSS